MNENQENIIGTILLMRGNNTTPIDEQEIAYLVELADNLESIANKRQKLSAEEKNEVITALHSAF